MSNYSAPLRDMHFVLRKLVRFDELASLPGYAEFGPELAEAVLNEAAKFATDVLSPLNAIGDREGARWGDGEVVTPRGWLEAYRRFVDGGWNGLSCALDHGGQGLPRVLSALVEEMWNGANISFALCSMLTRGAIEAIELRGSDTLKRTYLPKMVTGEWTGTMNLTEPQAGSDLAAVRTRAVPVGDETYRIKGQKIFITYGEHDLTENIVHLVLARTPDAPEGVKGISLFVVPKYLVNADGTLGARNDVRCVSIEHKLGIHASPTAVLAFGDAAGAIGWLVGEENRGLEYMFIMMNAARFSVGIEGIGLSELAYQRALAYANARVQGTVVGTADREKVAIVRHPDVRRVLLSMKSRVEAMRALACVVAVEIDVAHHHADAERRRTSQAYVDLMIPVVKGWCTENAIDIASLGVQVHGGMGFVEETGAAQTLRDARITTIYEGTTGIQALDLVGRKIHRDGGRAAAALVRQMRDVEQELTGSGDDALAAVGRALGNGIEAMEGAVQFVVANHGSAPQATAVGAVPLLELFGIVTGAWQLARSALVAHRCLGDDQADRPFLEGKVKTARFYADHILARAPSLLSIVTGGAESVLAVEDGLLAT